MKAKSDTKKYQHWCDECGAGFTTKVGQQYVSSLISIFKLGILTVSGSTQQMQYVAFMLPQQRPLNPKQQHPGLITLMRPHP